MSTLRRHGCMIVGRVGQRRVQRLRWSIELHEVLRLQGFLASLSPGGTPLLTVRRSEVCHAWYGPTAVRRRLRVLPDALHDRGRHRVAHRFPGGLKLGR